MELYECLAIIKVKKEKSILTAAYNEFRAMPYIVTAQPKHSDQVESRSNDVYDYAQLKVKFLSTKGTPEESFDEIKKVAISGEGDERKYKVTGLVGLIIRPDTLKQINS